MAITTHHAPHAGVSISLPRLPHPSTRVIALSLATVFVALMVDGILRGRAFFDIGLARAIQRIDLPYLDSLVRPVDAITSSNGAIAIWAGVTVLFVTVRWWLPALTMLALPFGGLLNNVIGDGIVDRARPQAHELARVIGDTDATSFPSGHVMGAVMLYGFLFVVADRIGNRPFRVGVKTTSLAIIGGVGFARIWYGAHFPTDILGAYALGGLLLIGIVALYRRLDASVGRLPFVKAAVPAHDEAIPHAHALTSLVLFRGETVSKVYAPGFVPRAIYWLAFQAPFPYIRNQAALRAAVQRRNLAALLTEYWYGDRRVARATGVTRFGEGYALNGEFVDGHEPADKAAAKAWLKGLRAHFEDAGLPTWQIDPRQPRAVDNVLETADGRYQIVDLESGLVAPIASLKTWGRAIRRNQAPMFDDVYFDVTRAYVAREEQAMRAAHGDAWFAALAANLNAAEVEAAAWHAGEPRLWSRLLRGLRAGFGIHRWPATAKAKLAGSQEKAREWIGFAIATWRAEGRITADEAATLRAQMEAPEFQAMLPHLGAHLVISIALRFPFGSIARFAWTAGALITATGRLLLRRIDRRQWAQAWRLHSPLVMTLSAMPGFGTFAYLAARPVRSNRLLMRVTADAMMHKAPWRLYERTGLKRLIARTADPIGGAAVELPAAMPDGADLAPATAMALVPLAFAPVVTAGAEPAPLRRRPAGAGRYTDRTAAAAMR